MKWFLANKLILNLDKTKFYAKYHPNLDMNISYNNKIIHSTIELKFLGLKLQNTLSWQSHVYIIIPKLQSACFIMRTVKPLFALKTLKIIYHAHFHSVKSYGLIFCGNCSYNIHIFRIQKRIVRIMMGVRPGESCRNFFKILKIFPLTS
jgi:hypothetical protein